MKTNNENIGAKPSYDLSHFHNPFEANEIIGLIEELTAVAYYMAGNDEYNLQYLVEKVLEQSLNEFNPIQTYCRDYDILSDLLEYYNDNTALDSDYARLSLEVDTEKTNTLRDSSFYKIYKLTFIEQ